MRSTIRQQLQLQLRTYNGLKKSKTKTSTPGTNVTPTEDQTERNPSYHERTFTNSRNAPMQPSNQRTAKRYAKALQAQEARRSIETPNAETVPPEVPEIIISASTTGNTSPYRPQTQSSPSSTASMSTASSRAAIPIITTANVSTTLTPKSISKLATETRSRTPARTLSPALRDTSVAQDQQKDVTIGAQRIASSISEFRGQTQHTTVLLDHPTYGKEKFNLNVDYTLNSPGFKRVSLPIKKALPPPLKPLSPQKAQLIKATLQPTVAMVLRERCPIHNVIHPNGCPNEIQDTNEPPDPQDRNSPSTLSSSDAGERPLVIASPTEEMEMQEFPPRTDFSTSIAAQATSQIKMDTNEPQSTEATQFGTTRQYKPLAPEDIFRWRNMSMSRQALWDQLNNREEMNPSLREAFLRHEGQIHFGQQMILTPTVIPPQYFAPPPAQHPFINVIQPPPPPGTTGSAFQP